MVSRPISWGHWGETGTVHCGERCSSPAGGNPATLGHKHQSFLAEDLFACRTVRRSALGFEALDREPFLLPWPRHGGAGQPSTLAAPPWCADTNQPDPLLCTPCPPALKMWTAAWWARSEPSETMQRWGTDSSRTSIPHKASLFNHAHSSPSHYHSNRTRGRKGELKRV